MTQDNAPTHVKVGMGEGRSDPTQVKAVDLDELLPSDAPPAMPAQVDTEVGMGAEEQKKNSISPRLELLLRKSLARFLTGCAGTGKTFACKKRIEDDPYYGLLTSSTGVAAVNLGGTTINSALKFFDTASLAENYERGKLQSTLAKIARSRDEEYHPGRVFDDTGPPN